MGRFRPGLRMTVLVAVVVPLAVALGFWQLDRAAQKRVLEESRLASYGALAIDERGLASAPEFTRVRLTGRYDATRQFFVDNYTRHGVPGYVVVTPFHTLGGRSVLVNRGWIAAPSLRAQTPTAALPTDVVQIEATRWPNTRLSIGAANDSWDAAWPKRVPYLDVAHMASVLEDALPIELRLDDGQAGSLEPIVVGEEMTPARHRGYAVQWFGLAIAMTVWCVVFGLRHGKGN